MIFRQFIQEDLACASYLIADEGVAVVIDPQLDIDPYLEAAEYHGFKIEHILETHNHADHVSGHGRLVERTGATIHIHMLAAPDYAHEAFEEGWELKVGCVTITALHTPGHRPEHTAFLLTDRRRSAEPWAVLTGDSLFVGDIARPDLAIDKNEGALKIFRSLNEKIASLPDHVEVWPGHLGGSMCGSSQMSAKPVSTIAFERAHNPLLRLGEKEFVAELLARIGPQPPNLENIVAINRGGLTKGESRPDELAPGDIADRMAAGAHLIDVRSSEDFDRGHIAGSVNLTVHEPGFASRLARLCGTESEIVFVGGGQENCLRAAERAQHVGLRGRHAYLAGGISAWCKAGEVLEETERIPLAQLKELSDKGQLTIIDVRDADEFEEGHILGASNIPWYVVRASNELPPLGANLVTVCASGRRAGIAAGIFQGLGYRQVSYVADGGLPDWQERGWPTTNNASA